MVNNGQNSVNVIKLRPLRDNSSITSAKRWVGGVRKWQCLLICSTICADVGGWVGLKKPKTCWRNNWMVYVQFNSSTYPLCLAPSETKFCPMQSRTRERMRNKERPNMKGLRRPHWDVQISDQWPITGTVNNATNGAGRKYENIVGILLRLKYLMALGWGYVPDSLPCYHKKQGVSHETSCASDMKYFS